MNNHLIITEAQANTIRGNHGKYSAIEPVALPDGNYIVPEACIADPDLVTVKTALETMDDVKQDIVDLPEVGQPVVAGKIYRYSTLETSKLLIAVQPHTRMNYLLEETPALFMGVREPFDNWIQPLGSFDVYNKGDKVTFEGLKYESIIANNIWSPTAYPAGWKKL